MTTGTVKICGARRETRPSADSTNFIIGLLTFLVVSHVLGGSVAEWLACWTQAQKGLGSNRSRDAVR